MRAQRIVWTSMIMLAMICSKGLIATAETTASVSVPRIVRFSGSLRQPTVPGMVGITFGLYKDERDGAPLWLETQNVAVDSNGGFTVLLGANHADGIPDDLFTSGDARWLGIRVDGEPEQERVALVSVPYALKAGDANTLGGQPASAFLMAAPQSGGLITNATVSGITATAAAEIVSGTTNYLPKFSDATSLTNSSIFENSGKIGIGTNNPESILDIAANSSQTVRFGTVPWALRIGQLQNGTQFIGIAVKKTGLNNSYVASSQNISTVNHTIMEFGYDGSMRLKQQAHQLDGTVLTPTTSFSMLPNGNVGIAADKPAQRLEVTGNIRIGGAGNGIIFPDGTIQKTATTGSSGGGSGTLTGVTAGTGLTGGGTSGSPVLSLNTSFTDAKYARLSVANTFTGNQAIGGDLSITGKLASGAHVVTGDLVASGVLSGTSVQAHVGAGVAGATAISAAADSEDATGLDVVASAATGATTGIHAAVNSAAGFAGVFDNIGGGSILLGRIKIGEYWVKRFRVDGSGRAYANNGYATGGADFAESFAVNGDKTQYVPGDVLVIDASGERRLALSQQPYSTLIAGVYSTRPGVLASPYDMDDPNLDREVPLAVIGVVPCKVSAENGPIAVGDLLVSSSLAGHAMKGTDRSRMLGAVLGKALRPLESGTGVIDVLVTLQ
ncbi:MAG TPA: hypothetical protein VFM10_00945 [Terriglobales bacterium]|nr:hypothetical protein [Terriglobales bacterium]